MGNTLTKDINREYAKLKIGAMLAGVSENFGQKEVREIRDKYRYTLLCFGNEEEREQAREIDGFSNWCESYTGKE